MRGSEESFVEVFIGFGSMLPTVIWVGAIYDERIPFGFIIAVGIEGLVKCGNEGIGRRLVKREAVLVMENSISKTACATNDGHSAVAHGNDLCEATGLE